MGTALRAVSIEAREPHVHDANAEVEVDEPGADRQVAHERPLVTRRKFIRRLEHCRSSDRVAAARRSEVGPRHPAARCEAGDGVESDRIPLVGAIATEQPRSQRRKTGGARAGSDEEQRQRAVTDRHRSHGVGAERVEIPADPSGGRRATRGHTAHQLGHAREVAEVVVGMTHTANDRDPATVVHGFHEGQRRMQTRAAAHRQHRRGVDRDARCPA